MLHKPFYDPEKSYEYNFLYGPFGAFSDSKVYRIKTRPRFSFLGQAVHFPFGIAAGPLVNSAFVKAAFEKGFDIAVYKTVRSTSYPCHPFPNVLAVNIRGDLTLEKAQEKFMVKKHYTEPLSITNSFGVPSMPPDVWQEDVKKALQYATTGQLLVLSFMGTVQEDQTQEEFIKDYVEAAKRAHETGVKALEVNLSCPNIGSEGLVCYNLTVTEKVCKTIRRVIGNTPLILKVGYYQNNKDVERLSRIAKEYGNAISAINTIQATIVDAKGKPALPGKMRLKSGVCGASIKWAGIDMVKKFASMREKLSARFEIIGIGGVMGPSDYHEYRNAGADCVMSATSAMWNPYLARQIKLVNSSK